MFKCDLSQSPVPRPRAPSPDIVRYLNRLPNSPVVYCSNKQLLHLRLKRYGKIRTKKAGNPKQRIDGPLFIDQRLASSGVYKKIISLSLAYVETPILQERLVLLNRYVTKSQEMQYSVQSLIDVADCYDHVGTRLYSHSATKILQNRKIFSVAK